MSRHLRPAESPISEDDAFLEEVLKRFPDWEIDYDNMKPAHTSTVRGWETLPVFVR